MYQRFGLLLTVLLCVISWEADGFLFSSTRKRDCIVTPWGKWKHCKGTEGRFSETRTRSVSQARNGGKPCSKKLTTIQTRKCQSAAVTSNLMVATIQQLAFPPTRSLSFRPLALSRVSHFSGRRPSQSVTATNQRKEKCTVVRDAQKNIIASGRCSRGRGKRAVDFPISLSGRFRRQTTEKFRDVLFLIDKSGSIKNQNVQKTRDFAAALVHVFCGNIELGRTRIAVATFTNKLQPNLIPFNRYIRKNQKDFLVRAIRNLRFSSYGSTHIGDAMRTARTRTLKDKSRGARHGDPNVKKMIVLISDGCSNGGISTKTEADALKREGVEVLVVFVGADSSCKKKVLVFDGGQRCFNRFFVDTWSDLVKVTNTLKSINTCQLETFKDLNTAC